MFLLCFLFGHTGDDTESGYHVCDRCGKHEYWCSKEIIKEWEPASNELPYEVSGILMNPFRKLKIKIRKLKFWLHFYINKNKDDLPF